MLAEPLTHSHTPPPCELLPQSGSANTGAGWLERSLERCRRGENCEVTESGEERGRDKEKALLAADREERDIPLAFSCRHPD